MEYENFLKMTFEPESPSLSEVLTAMEVTDHTTRLFLGPTARLKLVQREKLVKAFEAIPSIDGYLGVLAVPEVPMLSRKRLIGAQESFFARMFYADDFEGACFMWWERLVGAAWNGFPAICDDPQICEYLFESLTSLILSPSEVLQRSGLHGINEIGAYLKEVDWRINVRRFLESSSPASEQIRRYAIDVLSGHAR